MATKKAILLQQRREKMAAKEAELKKAKALMSAENRNRLEVVQNHFRKFKDAEAKNKVKLNADSQQRMAAWAVKQEMEESQAEVWVQEALAARLKAWLV
jgi:hypothetical protein